MAILCGQPHCAYILALAGVEPDEDCADWCRAACNGGGGHVTVRVREEPDSDIDDALDLGASLKCKSAASAAARASLSQSFQLEGSEKGVALYQKLAKRKTLVHNILGFSMETPEILDQLDLWDEVSGWMPSFEVAATRGDRTHPVDGFDSEESEGSDAYQESGAFGFCQQFTLFLGRM